jgi:ADP-ribose pyrophosphatase YjhB (NUDIX family)
MANKALNFAMGSLLVAVIPATYFGKNAFDSSSSYEVVRNSEYWAISASINERDGNPNDTSRQDWASLYKATFNRPLDFNLNPREFTLDKLQQMRQQLEKENNSRNK